MNGLTEHIVIRECRIAINIQRALSIFTSEGLYQYAGIKCGLGETLRTQVNADLDRVKAGKGDDIGRGLLDWVRSVRVRALQDLAACHAMAFTTAWGTVQHEQWSEVAPTWMAVLRTREDQDVGWVPTGETPSWNPGVATLRLQIQEIVNDLGETMRREDIAHWAVCALEASVTDTRGTELRVTNAVVTLESNGKRD